MKIVNNTPWYTEDLTALVKDHMKAGPLNRAQFTIEFNIIAPIPRVGRDKQPLLDIARDSYRRELVFEVLSPKRAAQRTDLLDRLSHTQTLQPHEAAMPPSIVTGIIHSLEHLSDGGDRHIVLDCECDFYDAIEIPLIRGDTGARIRPKRGAKEIGDSLRKLKDRLVSLEGRVKRSSHAISFWERRKDKYQKQVEIVAAKVERMKARFEKATKSMNQTEPLVSAINKED